ncbi:MAG: dephospho-CoA kinase [Bacteroidales bacterium]|nr:dephospho-CoA kinase [Bacteroidales bacterium]
MYRVGLTGGIGSGKSTVCKIFGVLGIPFFSADEFASQLMESDENIIREINQIAGKDLYKEGSLDRRALAELIFNDRNMIARVNNLVHPRVFTAFLEWSEQQDSPYAIMEAAILFESGGDSYTDTVVAVTAPLEERVMRVIERNNMSREEVVARISNQMDQTEMIGKARWTIDNSDNVLVIPQVIAIHSAINEVINRKQENG